MNYIDVFMDGCIDVFMDGYFLLEIPLDFQRSPVFHKIVNGFFHSENWTKIVPLMRPYEVQYFSWGYLHHGAPVDWPLLLADKFWLSGLTHNFAVRFLTDYLYEPLNARVEEVEVFCQSWHETQIQSTHRFRYKSLAKRSQQSTNTFTITTQ